MKLILMHKLTYDYEKDDDYDGNNHEKDDDDMSNQD